jgi:hypothetical protein
VAQPQNVVVFAPHCPKSEGCKGSWWRWNGEPEWLLTRVEEISKEHAVDPARRYLIGWSGGATYIGMRSAAWFDTFAAVGLAGGGMAGHTCYAGAGADCGPIYYLMGDRNPYFELAVQARDHFRSCGHEVTWALQRGAGHAAEWRRFAAKRDAMLAWFLDHPYGCAQATPPAPSMEPAPATGPSPPAATEHTPTQPTPKPAPPVARSCGCKLAGRGGGVGWVASLLALALMGTRRRARRNPDRSRDRPRSERGAAVDR